MALRDFIVKQKGGDAIEKENKTTVVGILAIVLIVLVVAVFMKVQSVALFADLSQNTQGFATKAQTFLGEHEVDMTRFDAIVGSVNVQGVGKRIYYAYPDSSVLVIDYGTTFMRVELPEGPAPGVLVGQYPDSGLDKIVGVLVNTHTNQFVIDGLTESALPAIPGSELAIYGGDVMVSGDEYYFQLLGNELVISVSGDRYSVQLTGDGANLVGSWTYAGETHPVSFSPADRTLTIQELF